MPEWLKYFLGFAVGVGFTVVVILGVFTWRMRGFE